MKCCKMICRNIHKELKLFSNYQNKTNVHILLLLIFVKQVESKKYIKKIILIRYKFSSSYVNKSCIG